MTIGQLLIAIESSVSASDPSVTIPCLYFSKLFYVSAILKAFVLSYLASISQCCIIMLVIAVISNYLLLLSIL